jgi:LysM repeat protein
MGKKSSVFIILSFLALALNGCVTAPRQMQPVGGIYHIVGSKETLWRIARTYDVDMGQIMRLNRINDPNQLKVGQELFIPGAAVPLVIEPYKPLVTKDVEKLVGPKCYSYRWRSVTMHHSATITGNAKAFDKSHRKRGMGGLFYHFVIGNGTGSGDGEIEVGWRWRKQKKANRPNDIQICLVGNFNRQKVSAAQYESLVKLITVLRKQYNIAVRNVRRHKDVTRKATDCPGRNFPYSRIISDLKLTK